MIWLTTLGFAFLLLSIQQDGATARSASRSPWADPGRANAIMNCLLTKIASSSVLPQQEKEDLESMMDTLMSAIKEASAKGRNSDAQLKAIDMAVASSMAELVVAEDAGNQASIAVKTQALLAAIEQCFLAVTGTVDRKFISEMNDMIAMFAREAATETNEIGGGFYGAQSSASSSFAATSQSGTQTYQSSQGFQGTSQMPSGSGQYPSGTYSPGTGSLTSGLSQSSLSATSDTSVTAGSIGDGGYTTGPSNLGPQISSTFIAGESGSSMTGFSQSSTSSTSADISTTALSGAATYPGDYPAGPGVGPQVSPTAPVSGAQSSLVSRVSNALSNAYLLRQVFSTSTSQQTAATVVQRAIEKIAPQFGVDANTLKATALRAIYQVPAGSDTSAYTQALSTAMVTGGLLSTSNIDQVGPQFIQSLLNSVMSTAQGLGMQIDTGRVQNDISSSSSYLSTSSSSSSFSQSSTASTTGYTGGSSYPGGQSVGPSGQRPQPALVSSQSDYSQNTGFASASTSRVGFTGSSGFASSGAGQISGLSVSSTLNAPNGLKSGQAAARISQLTSSIMNAVGPNGVDANALAQSLQAGFSSLTSSGMSASQAKVEVLLETIAGLIQLLSNTSIRGVNMGTSSSVTSSVARSIELALA